MLNEMESASMAMTNEQAIEFLKRYCDEEIYTDKCVEVHQIAIAAIMACEEAERGKRLTEFMKNADVGDDIHEKFVAEETMEIAGILAKTPRCNALGVSECIKRRCNKQGKYGCYAAAQAERLYEAGYRKVKKVGK